MTLGFLGLGKMGSRMVAKLAADGHALHIWNRTVDITTAFAKSSPTTIPHTTILDLLQSLTTPRIIWFMLPAGEATEVTLNEVITSLSPGDIVIDGGNANFRDTERRFQNLKKKNIRFLGIGVSGGIIAAEKGYPLMVGGDESAYKEVKPILETLAKPHGGHTYFGPGGAGHFVKMVHNGIEYGIMQSLGEGFEVLSKSPYALNLFEVAKLWQKGTLVSGFMLDRAVEVLTQDPTLSNVVGSIVANGEANWTVVQAKEEGVAVEIIERSLAFRTRSQTDPKVQASFTAKLIAALRAAFGGHELPTSSK